MRSVLAAWGLSHCRLASSNAACRSRTRGSWLAPRTLLFSTTTDSGEAPKLPIIARSNAVLPESAYKKVSALYLGEPGQQHIGLELPSPLALEPGSVVDGWLGGPKVPAGVALTAQSRMVLQLVAASMNNMPLALEIAGDFLHSLKNILARPFEKALVRDLFEYVFTEARKRYQPTEPSKEILVAMMYREELPLDNKLFYALDCSVVTNSLTQFVPGITMVPDASLVLLRVLSRDSCASDAVKLIGNGIDSVTEIISNARHLGDVLEEAGLQALRCRLVLAPEMEDMTLARLCGIVGAWITGNSELTKQMLEFEETVNPATAAFMFAPLGLKGWKYDGAVDRLSACSQGTKKNKAGFLADLDALEVSVNRPVRLIRPVEGESWDLCVKALNPATGEAFFVFFDDTYSTKFDENMTPLTLNEVTDHQKQYNRTKAVLGPSRPFLYVYRSSYVDVPSQVLPAANRAEDALPSRCLVLGREDTLSLMGPFSEIYKTARAAVGYKFGKRGEAKNKPYVKTSGTTRKNHTVKVGSPRSADMFFDTVAGIGEGRLKGRRDDKWERIKAELDVTRRTVRT